MTVVIDYYKDSSEEVFNKGIVHDYRQFNFDRIKECISLQEKIGLDAV